MQRLNFKHQDGDAALIRRLPSLWQRVLTNKGSMKALAHELGCAEGTAKSRTHRARIKLMALRHPGGE